MNQQFPPASGGAPPRPGQPPGQPQPGAGVDPHVQQTIMQRLMQLPPQDRQALITGISPAAAQVLKQVLPEVAAIIDKFGQRPPAAPPAAGGPVPPMQQGGPPIQQGAPPQAAAPRPKTALSRI